MFPSTTAAPSTYSPPASSMSGASGGKPDERLPRRRPSAAGTCGPWQSVPTGFSSAKKCSTIRLTSGSTRMNSGALPPGITIAAYSEGSTSAKATSTGQLRPGFSTYVSKSGSKSWTTSLIGRVVGAETYGSWPASESRYLMYIVSRSSAASPARISTFAIARSLRSLARILRRGVLLDGDGLRQVPRLIDVQTAKPRDAVREQLERQDR